jgi:sulfonate dioxygenase
MLTSLKARHSSERLSAFARANGGLCRKDPVHHLHPLIRVHPVTGEKALFVNDEWIDDVVGWKRSETEWLLKYLTDHISKGHDFQIRVGWKPGTVVVFDNRTVCRECSLPPPPPPPPPFSFYFIITIIIITFFQQSIRGWVKGWVKLASWLG